ncbi:hypothetical protein M758_UG289500, partial [Ceratodon purpureus]
MRWSRLFTPSSIIPAPVHPIPSLTATIPRCLPAYGFPGLQYRQHLSAMAASLWQAAHRWYFSFTTVPCFSISAGFVSASSFTLPPSDDGPHFIMRLFFPAHSRGHCIQLNADYIRVTLPCQALVAAFVAAFCLINLR